MLIFNTTIIVRSDLTLKELASVLSERLFGGLPFVSRDTMLSEEFPVLYLASPLLGHEVCLIQSPEVKHFSLVIQISNRFLISLPSTRALKLEAVEVSGLIAALLQDVDKLEMVPNPSVS